MAVHAVYTLEELATLWKISIATINNWLAWERAAGRGPTLKQLVVKLAKGRFGSKTRLIRADYASYLQDRYVFRVVARRQRKTIRALDYSAYSRRFRQTGQKLSP